MLRRTYPCRVVFDGQSRVNTPPWEGNPLLGYSWPRIAMSGLHVPGYDQPAISGTSLTVLASNFGTRAAPYIAPPSFEPTIYVICGGHSDYTSEGNTGAQVYADAWALADLARSKGAVYVVCTTTLPSTVIAGGQETQRQAGNALILADASNKFDAQINLDVPRLDNPLDTRSYFDGVHIYGFPGQPGPQYGTARAAEIAAPVLAAAVAAVS